MRRVRKFQIKFVSHKLLFRAGAERKKISRGVVVMVLERDIVVSAFELQLFYYVPIRTNTLAKGINPHILPFFM